MTIHLQPHARLNLISVINTAFFDSTESFNTNEYGTSLAYLYPAICSDTHYGIDGSAAQVLFADKLIELFGVTHLVWQFIDVQALPMNTLATLWGALGDIPTDDDDCIEESFLHFDVGSDRQEIWHWFESANSEFIVGDVMQGYLKKHSADIQKTKPVLLNSYSSFTQGDIVAAFESAYKRQCINPDLLVTLVVNHAEQKGSPKESELTEYATGLYLENFAPHCFAIQ